MTLNHNNTTQNRVCVWSVGKNDTSAIDHTTGKLVYASIALGEVTFKEGTGFQQ